MNNAGAEPLESFGRREFESLVQDLVRETAPRVFAVVQEIGDCEDAVVAAWGLALEGRTELITPEGTPRLSVRTPESALRFFSGGDRTRARLIWPLNLG
ncbi:hypothetical protein [Streptomyces sp. Wh19]|uniref:hypothetical protein n=1 Tax=Streptomyces sp. Wh19 TaxID=3076629 RepID=UPI0029587DE1|nr:hypothetical protein [Streptomyces sp. Wh19]MDV9196829.1 hypothetical protein [Streptomyces sp. Wh19]